ncbi:MAG: GNAT family N-acetyltransferase [Tropicimonas sp.]|uniref:GNAT family N-acetyltransferase n=1 Tax=Tropicimonas sp. TaxID=2067044 RepID=UPI003A856915
MSITPAGTTVPYTVTWLEMTQRPTHGWPRQPLSGTASLLRAEAPPVWYFLDLYSAVGRDYAWEDMHERSEAELADWLESAATSFHTLMLHGWPHGFFMLDRHMFEVCDIAYFGLVPQAIGRGLGRFLLQTAVMTAWDMPGVEKVTLKTCTLDHPRALQLYQRNGFVPVRRSEHSRVLVRPLDSSRVPA